MFRITALSFLFSVLFPCVDALAEQPVVYDDETQIIIAIMIILLILVIMISLISVRLK